MRLWWACVTDPAKSTGELRTALSALGIRDTHQIDAPGVSILSVWHDLLVCCRDGEFRWLEDWKLRICLADDPAGAAVRIARRYERLRQLPHWPI